MYVGRWVFRKLDSGNVLFDMCAGVSRRGSSYLGMHDVYDIHKY